MIGGMATTLILTLLVIPAIYIIWRGWGITAKKASRPSFEQKWLSAAALHSILPSVLNDCVMLDV